MIFTLPPPRAVALSTPVLHPVDHDVSQGVAPPSPSPLFVHGPAAVGTTVLSGPHHQPAIDNTLILPYDQEKNQQEYFQKETL